MILEPVDCPKCEGINVIKQYPTAAAKQVNAAKVRNVVAARLAEITVTRQVKQQISDMAINCSGAGARH